MCKNVTFETDSKILYVKMIIIITCKSAKNTVPCDAVTH